MARKKTTKGEVIDRLRQMDDADHQRALEWDRSPERAVLQERNRGILDNLSQISATYSNRV